VRSLPESTRLTACLLTQGVPHNPILKESDTSAASLHFDVSALRRRCCGVQTASVLLRRRWPSPCTAPPMRPQRSAAMLKW